jgi:hypothetical protein
MIMCRDGSSTDSSSLNDGDEEEDELSSAIIRSRKINKKVKLPSVLCLFCSFPISEVKLLSILCLASFQALLFLLFSPLSKVKMHSVLCLSSLPSSKVKLLSILHMPALFPFDGQDEFHTKPVHFPNFEGQAAFHIIVCSLFPLLLLYPLFSPTLTIPSFSASP